MADTKSDSIEETSAFTPRFNEAGLIPAIAQDAMTGDILMMAWMNSEAIEKTLETQEVHYWSRSRGELWHKGATSGHIQTLVSMHVDCDQDVVLVKVTQTGAACHTGRDTCFYRKVTKDDDRLTLKPGH
ncbi:phosphoribosyl-AMP cyclohydrolase [Parvularcula flava]|uniref:Phosphoribosyl-AMP cyclohydrolase n=1 Tax=Aquisalinus luteolus TaxID=1566827 RepID=A0A8J3ERH7_9PROT|nr:phosphoribosyl-AMP cyclohydrolase [Aquisalinus luteolus]NHK28568.1 phosphoribosyl-AMP cyclohydrolase [Aquisalinus luteolus]GGH98865.1 hypothetical protein GCM10011355_23470 [Aquisalinus luteolus]